MSHPFNHRAAVRIALVSVLLALLLAPLSWVSYKEDAENQVVALANEEAQRFLLHFQALDLNNEAARAHAKDAAATLAGGLFDIAEIYDPNGNKLAESVTDLGSQMEAMLPKHARPQYTQATYESLTLPTGLWTLRVMTPLKAANSDQVTGYFEGVRVVPDWQQAEIQAGALRMSAMAGLAALLCGLAIYPLVVHLSKVNQQQTLEVLDSHISMMEALGRAIAKRDSDTGAHNYRVAWIAAKIGERMGFTGAAMQSLIAGSFLHDVGKIGIPDSILLKPGKLTDEEMTIMRTHVMQGEDIVRGMGWLDGANEVVAGHHEKWNGSGYPRQLSGEAIPLSARIFAVADVFDALSSKRPYKEPMPHDQVMAILHKDTGTHFDPGVMAIFDQMVADLRTQLKHGDEDHSRHLLKSVIHRHFAV